jgi:tRNA(Ile2) C34 agmatinyltransferase TiaS
MIYIGLDDTDVLESRGTGHLAREIAAALQTDYPLLGVTRHQLLVDPRVPCTKNNSCAAIHLAVAADGAGDDDAGDGALDALFDRVRALMLADFQPGSDPGLCVALAPPPAITEYGRRAQREIVTQDEARALAAEHDVALAGLGGDEDGVIGALSAVGLAASGSDGRYVLVGRSRQMDGLQPVSAILAAGIDAVQTLDGQPVTEGLVQTDKLRPARRSRRPILVVEWDGTCWQPLKLD